MRVGKLFACMAATCLVSVVGWAGEIQPGNLILPNAGLDAVQEFDPHTNTIVQTIPLPAPYTYDGPHMLSSALVRASDRSIVLNVRDTSGAPQVLVLSAVGQFIAATPSGGDFLQQIQFDPLDYTRSSVVGGTPFLPEVRAMNPFAHTSTTRIRRPGAGNFIGLGITSSSHILAADYWTGEIMEYTASGNPLGVFVDVLTVTGANEVNAIAIDGAGNVYAAQNNAQHLAKFDANGNFLGLITAPSFHNPETVFYNPQDDLLYVGNAGDGRLTVVQRNGAVVDEIDMGGWGVGTAALVTTVWYVDDDASDGGSGATWSTAFKCLRDALPLAAAGDEIRVAQGTYRPDRDMAHPGGTGDRTATFQLRNQVIVLGGFAGVGAPDPDARDVSAYPTILSGDLAGNDGPNFANTGENSYHVVTGSGTDATAVLDGFTVKAGNANGAGNPNDKGAGILNIGGSPTIRNCTIAFCQSSYNGAGVLNTVSSRPTFEDCVFQDNLVQIWGGAMTTESGCQATITGCLFQNNTANGEGGALDSYGATVTVTGCTFTGNHANGIAGAAQFNGGTQASVIECVFTSNSSGYGAGAVAFVNSSTGAVRGCTFEQNSARYGGALAIWSGSSPQILNCWFRGNAATGNGGAADINAGSPVIRDCLFASNSVAAGGGSGGAIIIVNNSNVSAAGCTVTSNSAPLAGGITVDASTVGVADFVLWGNTAASGTLESKQLRKSSGTLTVSYCDVQGWTGGLGGTGNFGLDPLFVDPDGPDNNPATWQDNDYHLAGGSPCIDSGDPTYEPLVGDTDLDGFFRVRDGDSDGVCRVDMGAYEYGPIADCNSNGIDDTCDIASGVSQDCNSNGRPDECEILAGGDFNADGKVDFSDFLSLSTALAGPNVPPGGMPPECLPALLSAFDADADADVDLVDFALFQTAFTGNGP